MGHGKRGIKNEGKKTKVKTKAYWIDVSCEFGLCLQRLFMVFLHPHCRVRNGNGEVAEWLKAHAWKACLLERVTRVRIPVSPQKRSRTHEEFRLRFFLKALQYLGGKSKPCQN